jgi:hypothetical protein
MPLRSLRRSGALARASLVTLVLQGDVLAQTTLLRFEDAVPNPWDTMSAVGIGDVDGDGLGDVAIARPYAQTWSGSVAVSSSRTAGELWHVDGARVARLGLGLAAGEDVNRDGRSDVVAMSYPLPGAPMLHLLSGVDGSPIWTVPDGATGSRALAFAADLDGDGIRDLLCGVPFLSDRGVVQLRSGASGALLSEVQGASGDYLGGSVAGLGDVDRDGIPDFAAGVHQGLPGSGQAGPGYVAVFSGRNGALLRRMDGTIPGSDFGAALAALDDRDGDGLADLLVGAPLENGGAAYLLSSASGARLRSYVGAAGSELGQALCALGDIDGDGVGEYAISAPREGRVGVVRVYSGATGALLFALSGEPGQRLGHRLASAGDPNVDGVADLLVLVAIEGGLTRSWISLVSGSAVAPLGLGCSGASSPPVLTLDRLTLGSSSTFTGRGLPPGTPGCVFFSLPPLFPTALDPDCTLHLEVATIFGLLEVRSDAGGSFAGGLLLPCDPWLAGTVVVAQAAFPAPSALPGVALTQAMIGALSS